MVNITIINKLQLWETNRFKGVDRNRLAHINTAIKKKTPYLVHHFDNLLLEIIINNIYLTT